MKQKLLLAWRVLVAAGMAGVLLIAGAIALVLYRDYKSAYFTREIWYNNTFQYEYSKNTVRIRDISSGKFLTPKLTSICKGGVSDTLTVFFQGEKRGFLNVHTGKIEIPAKYQKAWIFSEGLGAVVMNGKVGFINKKGETVIPCRYAYNSSFPKTVNFLFKNGYCTVFDDSGKAGLIDKNGKWVILPQYDYINPPVNGYRIVRCNGKFGLLNDSLACTLPVEYDCIVLTDNGVILRQGVDQKMYAYDLKTILQPVVFDSVENLYYNTGKIENKGNDIFVLSDYKKFGCDFNMMLIQKKYLSLQRILIL